MPYANNQGVKIYYEVAGEGPPIVLCHGAMGNMSQWTGYGYVDLLKDKYKVILLDARGHGQSDKLYTRSAYDGKPMADDVVAVLDDLGMTQADYWGFSMGGYIGFGLAKYHPQRLRSLILGGASPYLNNEPHVPDPLIDVMRLGVEESVDAMIEAFRVWAGGTLHPTSVARLRVVDPRAMMAFFEYSPTDEAFDDILPTMTMPCLLYVGDQDDPEHVLTYAKQMPNVTTYVLPGLDHMQTSAAVDLIVPRIVEFLTTGK